MVELFFNKELSEVAFEVEALQEWKSIAEELGFDAHYKVSNPAKWMAAANDTLELVNFFESTNTSYEVNAGVSGKKEE